MTPPKRTKGARRKPVAQPREGKARGRPASGRERVAVTLLMPAVLRRELRIAAAREEREMSEILEDALTAYLESKPNS